MELQSTLEHYALQLKNVPRTLVSVAGVVQKMMKTLYDAHFPDAENHRPGRNPDCPDSDILTIAWLLEYIGADSEHSGYRRFKETQLRSVFPCLPERSRFNRRRRNLWGASEVIRRTLTQFLPHTDVYIVDSFPMPICDEKRAKASKSDLKWADGSGTLATYGHAATKSLGTFFGFRGHLLTTHQGVPVDVAIAGANIDDREVLGVMVENRNYPILLGDKGYVSEALHKELLATENTCLLPTHRRNQKHQYPQDFRKQHCKMRRRIETTISQLTQQFGVSRIRARNQWGLQTRMSNKIGACLLGTFLNQCLGRPLMKLKDLVLA